MMAASSTSFQPDHGVEHGVVEMPQRRVRRHAVDAHVESAAPQTFGEAAGPPLDEVAAIRDAADDRVAPLLRVDRELGRRDHVPHHVGPAHIGVAAIAAVVRQTQVAASANSRICATASSWVRSAGEVAGSATTRAIGSRLDIRFSWPCALSSEVTPAAGRARCSTDCAGRADPQSDAATIHPCKCIWSAGPFGTPCSVCP